MKLLIFIVLLVLLVVYLKRTDRISYKYTSKGKFEKRTTPCIITGAIDHWDAHKLWSFEQFTDRFRDTKFMFADRVDSMKFIEYNDYCRTTTDDEPLYIFDASYGVRPDTKSLLNDYDTPEWFSDDVFEQLGDMRPPYQWFIIGPTGSGSDLHVDPLGTSAWNALVQGKKEWFIFHPDAPIQQGKKSGAAWIRDEYPMYRHLKHQRIIQNPGEILYIPPGWWHIAINRKPSIAVTHNYLHPNNLEGAKSIILRERPDIYQKLFLD